MRYACALFVSIFTGITSLSKSGVGSPGLVVMRGGSHSKVCGFESRRRILDGHDIFFTLICCKNCNDVCLKRPKINENEAGVGPFF